MKSSVVKGIVFTFVFLLAVICFGALTNRGNLDMTAKMSDATLPLIYLDVSGREVNTLPGYKEAMNTAYMQDCITPIPKDRTLRIGLYENGVKMEKAEYELRSIDGQRLIEKTEITKWEQEDGRLVSNLKFKDLLEEDTEYMLVLLVNTTNGECIYYYSKILVCDNKYIADSIDFVLDFHEKTLNKEQAGNIKKYLETTAGVDNSNFYSTNIHNSFEQITWGNLQPKEESVPRVTVLEINDAISSYGLEYIVSNTENDTKNYYRIKEYYRVRYTENRMYLLEYDRKMEKIFIPAKNSYDSTKIILGIGDMGIDLQESDDGKNIAFVTADRLFAFNITDEKMSLLFSFYDAKDWNKSELYDKHDIKILNVDEMGNTTFMVYGYMNRGIHEGKVGVAVYTYNSVSGVVSEQVYIPYNKSYDVLKKDIEKLSYINKNNKLYLSLEKAIYEINITEKTYQMLATEHETGEYKISESGRMVVWQDSLKDEYSAKKLYLMDLSTEDIMGIEAGNGECIRALGFIGEDLVYGLADANDIIINSNEEIEFYMHTVYIQNETGVVLKEYKQDGIYVKNAVIESEMIRLNRAEKVIDGENEWFKNITDDQIVSAKEGVGFENYVETGYSNLYKTFVRIVIDGKITPKDVRYAEPEQEMYEGEKKLDIGFEKSDRQFYVYRANCLVDVFDKEAMALQCAVSENAWVLNDYGNYVWRKENRRSKNQIMAIKAATISDDKNSLGVCLDTILAYEGIMRNSSYLLSQGQNVRQILQENLENTQVLEFTDVSLDSMLYYVGKDIPVLVRMGNNKAVLITGYNDSEIVILNPDLGTLSKMKKKQAEIMFEEAGGNYITYVYAH